MVDRLHGGRAVTRSIGLPIMKKKFHQWARSNYAPVNETYMLNVAIGDRAKAKKAHKEAVKAAKNMISQEERQAELEGIIEKYGIAPEKLGMNKTGSKKTSEKELFKLFLNNQNHAFLDLKASCDITRALQKARYMKRPDEKKREGLKERVLTDLTEKKSPKKKFISDKKRIFLKHLELAEKRREVFR